MMMMIMKPWPGRPGIAMMMIMKPWPGRPGIAMYFKFFIELATVTQHRDREWNKTCIPIHFPPSPFNGCTTPSGSMPPTLYKQQCWFFYVPQESEQWKSCETGPTVFHPYLRGLMSQPIFFTTSIPKFSQIKTRHTKFIPKLGFLYLFVNIFYQYISNEIPDSGLSFWGWSLFTKI